MMTVKDLKKFLLLQSVPDNAEIMWEDDDMNVYPASVGWYFVDKNGNPTDYEDENDHTIVVFSEEGVLMEERK